MIWEHRFKAMGCSIYAALDGDSPRLGRLLQRLPAWFEEWEETLSRFQAESELNRLNRSAGEVFRVSPVLWEVLLAARKAWQFSAGLVNPAILDALAAAGYERSFESLSGAHAVAPQHSASPIVSFDEVEMIEEAHSVRLPYGVRLDLGGVAKGWAAQEAMKRLMIYGPALVNAGGDIAVSGLLSGGKAWEIGITDPHDAQKTVAVLALGRGGVATSGRDYRRWLQDGSWRHHIIDPRTGSPAESDLLTATIIAPNVLEAEAAAKVTFMLGSAEGQTWLEAHPGVAAYLIPEHGEPISTRNLSHYLRRIS